MKKIIVSVFVLAIITSCVALPKKTAQIRPGLTMPEVEEVYGPPMDRQFDGKSEAWQYCSTGFASDEYTVIFFNNGRVTGLKKYSGQGMGSCTQFFRTINFLGKDTNIHYHSN